MLSFFVGTSLSLLLTNPKIPKLFSAQVSYRVTPIIYRTSKKKRNKKVHTLFSLIFIMKFQHSNKGTTSKSNIKINYTSI